MLEKGKRPLYKDYISWTAEMLENYSGDIAEAAKELEKIVENMLEKKLT